MKISIKNTFRLSLAAGLLIGAGLVHAELAVVVHPSNALTTISAKDVSRIYLGKARSFPGGGKVKPINLPSGNAARDEFYQTYTGMNDAQVKGHWSKLMFSGKGNPPDEVSNDAEVKSAVAGDSAAMGYIDKSAVDSSVKVLTVSP